MNLILRTNVFMNTSIEIGGHVYLGHEQLKIYYSATCW